MVKSLSLEQKLVWKEKLEQQKNSGQPVNRWCKENGISIGKFYYWKEQFFPKQVKRSEFRELTSQKAGIRLECNGVFINLEADFDAHTLKRCVALLRELPC